MREMIRHIWPAKKGERTVYVVHGIWEENGNIHVAIPATGTVHFNYRPGDKYFEAYKKILVAQGRWPADEGRQAEGIPATRS